MSPGNWCSSPRSCCLPSATGAAPPTGSRALSCLGQAVLGDGRWYRDRTTAEALARGHGISRATAYRYLDEVITVLAEQAPDLRGALERAKGQGFSHVILDGKIIACDRCKGPAVRVKGEPIDLWYSGKAHRHGGNIQAVLAPDGFPRWVSSAEPGSVHDLTAARAYALPAPSTGRAATNLPTLADLGYDGAGLGIHIPVKQPPGSRELDVNTRTRNVIQRSLRCLANAGSPCSPAAGAPSATSPPAPARSATSPAPHSSSPISSTATSHEFR